MNIVRAILQTKQWRNGCEWYVNGKHNECELYQRNIISLIIGSPLVKSSVRINTCDYRMQINTNPMKSEDGFDWTEDFDGFLMDGGNELYFNLKMVCSQGGSQTRTLREVYHFIKSQLEHLLIYRGNAHFVNILDGDECHRVMPKFNYLIELPKYMQIKNRVYVGDLAGFQEWFQINKCPTI